MYMKGGSMGRNQKYTKKKVSRVLKEGEIDQHPTLPSRTTITKLFKTTKMSDVWRELNISGSGDHSFISGTGIEKYFGFSMS